MRLTKKQQEVIREVVTEIFGNDSEVLLFGSRTDDAAKGGDIDLLIKCAGPVENADMRAAKVAAKIHMRIGEQKIDILYHWPGLTQSRVHQVALEEGIKL